MIIMLISAYALSFFALMIGLSYGWYDSTYDYKQQHTVNADISTTMTYPCVINGTSGFDLDNPAGTQIVWTLCKANSTDQYLYYDNNSLYVYANESEEFPFDVEFGNMTSSNPYQVWGNLTGLVLRYSFNQTVTDSTSGGNDGTSTYLDYYTGLFGYGINSTFNTSDSYITFPDVFGETSSENTQYAVSVWAKTDSSGISAGHIISMRDYSDSTQWRMAIDKRSDDYYECVVRDSGSNLMINITHVKYNDGDWHHFVCVKDNDNLYFYVDGGAELGGESLSDTDTTMSGNFAAVDNFYIGKNARADNNEGFPGQIDELLIFNGTNVTYDMVKFLYEVGSMGVLGAEEAPDVDNPPATSLITPADDSEDTDGTLTFNCSATDDNDIDNITLWHNGTGTWHANSTNTSVDGTYDFAEFTVVLDTGANHSVIWNCLTTDNSSQTDWANANYTININTETDYSPTCSLNTPADLGYSTSYTVNFTYTPTDETGFSQAALYLKPSDPLKIAAFSVIAYEDPSNGDEWQQNLTIRLPIAVSQIDAWGADYIVSGGDLVDDTWGAGSTCDGANNSLAIENYETMVDIFNDTSIPMQGLVGNHDLCHMRKADFVPMWEIQRNYSYVDIKGFRLIFLDTIAEQDGYDSTAVGLVPALGATQRAWLTNLTTNTSMPSIIFMHQVGSNYTSTSNWYIADRGEFQGIIEAANSNVIAVFESNLHGEYTDSSTGILYASVGMFQAPYEGGTQGNALEANNYLQIVAYPNNNSIWYNYSSLYYGDGPTHTFNNFPTMAAWDWGAKATNASILTNNSINFIETTLNSTFGDINYTWAIAVTDSNSQTTFSTNRTLLLDTTIPTLTFTSPTDTNQTESNNTYFYVNVSATENLDTCYLDLKPEVIPTTIHYTEITYSSDAYNIEYNGTTYGYDAEHAELQNTTTEQRVVFYYNLTTITSNVTNATFSFGVKNGSDNEINSTNITIDVYYHTDYALWDQAVYHEPDYCYDNKDVCWNYTENSTLLTDSIFTIPLGVHPYSYRIEDDVTELVNQQLQTNGGHGGIMLSLRVKGTNITQVQLFNENNNLSERGFLNLTVDEFSNITMTVDGSYAYYNATFILNPPNNTEYYYRVYCNDSEGNLGVTEDRAWSYVLQSEAPAGSPYSCNSCEDCSAYIMNSSAGDTVQLTQTITDTDDGTCVDFGGNDRIIFDCQGFSVLGDYDPLGYGISITGADNATVQNCIVAGFNNGIRSTSTNQSNNLTLYNTTVQDMPGTLLVLAGNNSNITDVTLYNSTGVNGLTLQGGSNSFTRVNASYNDGYGFYLINSGYNTLTNVTAINNGDDNILLGLSYHNVIQNSTFKDATGSDYNVNIPSSNNNLTNSVIQGGNGIYVVATGCYIYNNEINATGNSISGLYSNTWNMTQTTSANILGYSGTGGNYHADYTGVDRNGDGIGDTLYNLSNGNIDYLPLIDPDYSTITATTPDGDSNWTFSAVAADDELVDIDFTSTANVNNTIYFTMDGDLSNISIVSINSTTNLTLDDAETITINLTINSSCPAGSYYGNFTWTSYNDSTQTGDINISFTVDSQSANIDITNSSWSAAFTAGDTSAVYFNINNTGNYDATNCNMSFSSSVGSASFSQSSFTVTNTTEVQVLATFSGTLTGTDSTAYVIVTCTASALGGTDSDTIVGSISISAAGGGGSGSGGDTIIIQENVTLGYTVGDGTCDLAAGENPANSEDCQISLNFTEIPGIQTLIVVAVLGGAGYLAYRTMRKTKKSSQSKWAFP